MKIYIVMLISISLYSNSGSDNVMANKIIFYNSIVPQNIELRKRVITTVCCNDCDALPKVENAGQVINQNGIDFQMMHNGIKIIRDCYYGSWMTTLIELLKGHHEPQEEKAFHEVLKYIPDNAVMIELGSYWGYYSMWFQKQIPNARNYLIEPDPKNLEIGKKNFALNSFNGSFVQAMIGQQSLKRQIFTDWNYNKHEIDQISIDDFALENNINFIHILHSDIQGAEVDMLKGCKRLIDEKRIGYFFISTHRGVHESCLTILKDANLEILVSTTREESFSADGLIVAKLPCMKGPSILNVSHRTVQFCNFLDWIVEKKDINDSL